MAHDAAIADGLRASTEHRGRARSPAGHGPDLRRHASSYSAAALRRWAADARSWCDRGLDVFVYFDNDAEGHAVRNAREFAQLTHGERSSTAARAGRRRAG